MSSFSISKEEALSAAALSGLQLVGALCPNGDQLVRIEESAGLILGWLGLVLEDGQHLIISVKSVDIMVGGLIAAEVFIPTLDVAPNVPDLPRWPGGPPCKWVHIPELEEGITGYVLESVEILSTPPQGTEYYDAGLFLRFSGPDSLLVVRSEVVPMTLDVSRVASDNLRWDGPVHPATARGLRIVR